MRISIFFMFCYFYELLNFIFKFQVEQNIGLGVIGTIGLIFCALQDLKEISIIKNND